MILSKAVEAAMINNSPRMIILLTHDGIFWRDEHRDTSSANISKDSYQLILLNAFGRVASELNNLVLQGILEERNPTCIAIYKESSCAMAKTPTRFLGLISTEQLE